MIEQTHRVVRASNASPMTLDGTRTFLLGWRAPFVIDPGPADETHLEAVLQALGSARPAAILLTHSHPDHAAGAVAMAKRTAAPIWMASGALRDPFPPERVDRWLEDGERIEIPGGPLCAWRTPGHCPEHLAFLWETSGGRRTLFAGDLFLGQGDTTVVSHPEGNVGAYLRSLELVENLRPTVIEPAHGPAMEDPAGAVERYRAHRLGRVAEVRGLLRTDRGATVEEITKRIYGEGLDPALRSAARGSVAAVLEYLRLQAEDGVGGWS